MLALKGRYTFVSPVSGRCFRIARGKLFFQLAGVPPVANFQVAAHVLTGNTGEHVVVAG